MTAFRTLAITAAAIAAASSIVTASSALAGGRGKETFVQDYTFDKPMHGFSGHASGGYYCDYQRLPNRQCTTDRNGRETCKIVSWTLREMCQ